jgi:hypothetical protein
MRDRHKALRGAIARGFADISGKHRDAGYTERNLIKAFHTARKLKGRRGVTKVSPSSQSSTIFQNKGSGRVCRRCVRLTNPFLSCALCGHTRQTLPLRSLTSSTPAAPRPTTGPVSRRARLSAASTASPRLLRPAEPPLRPSHRPAAGRCLE